MNKLRLIKAGVDVGEGIERFGGNVEMYEKYLRKFSDDISYEAMCNYIKADDAALAFKAAHTLKGLAGNLSINKLYNDISPLVEELRSGRLDNADKLLEPIAQDYDEIILALSEGEQ